VNLQGELFTLCISISSLHFQASFKASQCEVFYHNSHNQPAHCGHIFDMSTLSKLMDPSILGGVESILQHTQKDDLAFLALIILSGIFYNVYIKEKPDVYHHVWFERPQAADANAKGADTRDIGVKLEESVCPLL
jgi:hypothetical protein